MIQLLFFYIIYLINLFPTPKELTEEIIGGIFVGIVIFTLEQYFGRISEFNKNKKAYKKLFDEIIEIAKKCRYVDCTHVHEPDCEVLLTLKSGELDMDKYSNYINLKKEAEYNNMSEFEKKEKEQKFGKFIKTAKKSLRKRNY